MTRFLFYFIRILHLRVNATVAFFSALSCSIYTQCAHAPEGPRVGRGPAHPTVPSANGVRSTCSVHPKNGPYAKKKLYGVQLYDRESALPLRKEENASFGSNQIVGGALLISNIIGSMLTMLSNQNVPNTPKKTATVFQRIGALEGLGSASLWLKLFLEWKYNSKNIGKKENLFSEMIGGITHFLGISGAVALGVAYGVRLGTIWVPRYWNWKDCPLPEPLENEEYEDIREKECDFFDWLAKIFGA